MNTGIATNVTIKELRRLENTHYGNPMWRIVTDHGNFITKENSTLAYEITSHYVGERADFEYNIDTRRVSKITLKENEDTREVYVMLSNVEGLYFATVGQDVDTIREVATPHLDDWCVDPDNVDWDQVHDVMNDN